MEHDSPNRSIPVAWHDATAVPSRSPIAVILFEGWSVGQTKREAGSPSSSDLALCECP